MYESTFSIAVQQVLGVYGNEFDLVRVTRSHKQQKIDFNFSQ